MEGGFKESEDQVLELPDDDPITFSHFLLWLYTGSIIESHESHNDITWKVLISVYLFGDVRGIPRMQNEAIDLFIDKSDAMNQVPGVELNLIYENTLDRSPLRKLIVDLFTFNVTLADNRWFSEQSKALYPQSFLIDLAKSLYEDRARFKPKNTTFRAVGADYHIHEDVKKEVSYNLHCCQSFIFYHRV